MDRFIKDVFVTIVFFFCGILIVNTLGSILALMKINMLIGIGRMFLASIMFVLGFRLGEYLDKTVQGIKQKYVANRG